MIFKKHKFRPQALKDLIGTGRGLRANITADHVDTRARSTFSFVSTNTAYLTIGS